MTSVDPHFDSIKLSLVFIMDRSQLRCSVVSRRIHVANVLHLEACITGTRTLLRGVPMAVHSMFINVDASDHSM
jgi:hypothetical protein